MPTYEYACRSCDHTFEIVQSFKEDSLTTCPECERDELRKVYNAAGIIFKGDGWHIKDYASKGAGSSTSATSDTTTDSGSDSSSDASTAGGSAKSDGKKKQQDSGSSGTTKAAS